MWSCGPVLPPSLVDLLEKTAEEVADVGEQEKEQEIDYEEIQFQFICQFIFCHYFYTSLQDKYKLKYKR